MTSLADLHRAVQSTLASKRLGQPVFIRYLWYSLDEPESIVPRLTQLSATVRDWLGQKLVRLHAVGSVATGQVSLTLEFREGGSALVSWARSRSSGNSVDLMVIGNRGALYHDAGAGALWETAAEFAAPPAEARLQRVLELALRSSKPEPAGEEAKP